MGKECSAFRRYIMLKSLCTVHNDKLKWFDLDVTDIELNIYHKINQYEVGINQAGSVVNSEM